MTASEPKTASEKEPGASAENASSDTTDENAPILTDDGDPEDTEWEKHTQGERGAWHYGRLMNSWENGDSYLEILPSRDQRIALQAIAEGESGGVEFRQSWLGKFTPEQGEALAAAILSAVEQARDGGAFETDQ